MTKSVSDYIASSMQATLNSAAHKSLFSKFASSDEESSVEESEEDCSDADDSASEEVEDESDACDKDEDLETSAHYDSAIDSLLVASASLDSLGFGRGSALSLKLASLVVEAKKKDPAMKEKMEAMRAMQKKKKDVQMAKDKAAKDKEKEKLAKEKEKAKMLKEKEKAKAEKEKADKLAKEKAAKEKAAKK